MELKQIAINKLIERGVEIEKMAQIVLDLQKQYNPTISLTECNEAIKSILSKREVIHTILTGIAIDECVEKNLFMQPLNDIINNDYSLYGIDEILALSIVNIYGSIAFTTFGYLDKTKPSIIGKLDKNGKKKKHCNTFLDDIVCAIISSGCSKIAHKKRSNDLI